MKPEDIPMSELKTFALDFSEEGDIDGVKQAIDAIERAALKAGVDRMAETCRLINETHGAQFHNRSDFPRLIAHAHAKALAQLDKEATDGKATE